MQLFFIILHVFLSLILILIILLQPGKDSADIFGGGAGGGNKMYGNRSQQSPIGKATTLIAVMFMVTSITLALYSSKRAQAQSELDDVIKELQKEITSEDIEREAQKIPSVLTVSYDKDQLAVIQYQPTLNENQLISEYTQTWNGNLKNKSLTLDCRKKCKQYQSDQDPDNFKVEYWEAAQTKHPDCVDALKQTASGDASVDIQNKVPKCLPLMYETCTTTCFEGETNTTTTVPTEESPKEAPEEQPTNPE